MRKIKVLFVCYFSNQELRDNIPLSSKRKYFDSSVWIPNLIREFRKRNDIEVHVILFHQGLLKCKFQFFNNGIFFYVFRHGFPIVHKKWPSFFPIDFLTNYKRNRIIVNRLIRDIKPDIVNLHGAENDYYSASVLDIKNIPVYVCIQGIYNNPERFNEKQRVKKSRLKIEYKIHRRFKYFGISAPFMIDLLKRDNPNPILLERRYPITFPELQDEKLTVKKEFDFVYFGRIRDVKGIEDILAAIEIVKRTHKSDILFNIIGPGEKNYIRFLKDKIKILNIQENVIFSGHYKELKDVHKQAVKSKYLVIAPKFDTIPGTIIEGILLGLPVITNNAGGIPYLNKDGQTVLISEKGNINELAANMIKILNDDTLANELRYRAKEFVLKEFAGKISADRFVDQYMAIIAHYYQNKPISEVLLYKRIIK